MFIKKKNFGAVVLGLCFVLSGCVGTNRNMNSNQKDQNKTHQTQKNTENLAKERENIQKMLGSLQRIEQSFLAQDCPSTLKYSHELALKQYNLESTLLPDFTQLAINVCNAKLDANNQQNIQKAIHLLEGQQLRYPIFNEVWLRNTLSDFYLAINDKSNALEEKKKARDLLLFQQSEIPVVNAEIAKLSPNDSVNNKTTEFQNAQTQNQLDQIVATATQLMNNDAPEQAIALIDTLPAQQRTDNVKRLRTDAVSSLVAKLRYRVRDLFVRASQQSDSARKETLTQCRDILSGIINNYPDYSDISAIKNNLKQVQRELNK